MFRDQHHSGCPRKFVSGAVARTGVIRTALGLSLAILAGWGGFGTALAGVGVFTSGGPEAGTVYSLTTDPRTPDVVYASTISGGVFKSTTAGSVWSPINTGLATSSVRFLAVDRQSLATLYAANGFSGVFRSGDGGVTWNARNNGLPFPSNNTHFVNAVVVDPQMPATVYAGIQSVTSDDGAVFKSTTNGAQWSRVLTTTRGVELLVIDPQAPTTLYAATFGAGVFKTTNAGASWTQSNVGLTGNALFLYTLAIDPGTTSVLYAGTGNGVFKSTNGGSSWSASNTGIAGLPVNGLAVDPQAPATVYAGTFQGTAGAFKSTNGGLSWTPINVGLTNRSILDIAVDSQRALVVYAATEGGGVFKSTNGGASWSPSNAGLTAADVGALVAHPQAQNVVYAGTGGGVFSSTAGGAAWSFSNTGITDTYANALAIRPDAPATLYAGTSQASPDFLDVGTQEGTGGVFKSTDGGATWSQSLRASTSAVTALAIDPLTPTVVYAGAGFGGIYKTSNGGSTWSLMNVGLPVPGNSEFIAALAVDPVTPTTVYLGTSKTVQAGFSGRIFKSTNGGASWTQILAVAAGVRALAIDPKTPTILYAGTFGDGGVFKSTNGGFSWAASNAGLADHGISAVLVDPDTPSIVYAGTFARGVFRSTNGGASWSAFGAGVPLALVLALAINRGGVCVHAGTGGSVFDFATQANTDCPAPPTLAAALSATSQSVQVGTAAQTFATIENLSGRSTASAPSADTVGVNALSCGVTQLTGAPTPFSFQAVDPTTNQPIAPKNTPINIPPGAARKFVVTIETTSPVCALDVQFGFRCTNSKLAPIVPGVNTMVLSATSGGLCGMTGSLSASRSTFTTGQTLTAGGSLRNPGIPGTAADFYLGILRPDNSIEFFTGTGGSVFGHVADLGSFRPIAVNVPLTAAFSVDQPTFVTRQWTAADPRGPYVLFMAAVKTGALAGGTIANDQILMLATVSYSFQ